MSNEQQYPEFPVLRDEKNKTSWMPSGKNKAEHRHLKHPEEYQKRRKEDSRTYSVL
jgi:hypothetical protein